MSEIRESMEHVARMVAMSPDLATKTIMAQARQIGALSVLKDEMATYAAEEEEHFDPLGGWQEKERQGRINATWKWVARIEDVLDDRGAEGSE